MKKLFILILLSIATLTHGQEMSVKSFYLAETDLTANTPGTMVYDQNGNVCALIKVETTVDGFSFDVGSLGVSEVKRVGGEIWVYVPYGIRRITLSHPQLGVVRDYQIPCPIERGRTYIMSLVAGTVKTIVEHAVSKQFLFIELDPKDAILEINDKIKATDNGIYQELLPFGKWQYKAYCQNYHDIVGVVDISDPDNTHSLNLKLKPAFGHISVLATVQPEIAGAAVYIDDRYIGEVPLNNIQINSGSHRMRIIKELYEAYNETFAISDEENKRLTPYLTPDFAEVTLTTISGADIFINGELKGNQRWSGKLPCGSYIFETRKKGHIAYKTTREITRNDHARTINIDGPTPIYGSLVISSTPAKAKVYIDSEYAGETPKYVSKQVVGEYSIRVELNGYESQTKSINITEGNEASISFVLEKSSAQLPSYTDETSVPSNGKRTIYSKEATIKVGEIITAELAGEQVERWEINNFNASYVTFPSKGKLKAIKEGNIQVWGYVNGSPKLFRLEIVNFQTSLPGDKPAKTIRTKECTLNVGDHIVARLPEGDVTRWEINEYQKDYVYISQNILTAKKAGYLNVWGYVNGSPKLFKITIK